MLSSDRCDHSSLTLGCTPQARQLRSDIKTSSQLLLVLETRSAISHDQCGVTERGCFDEDESGYEKETKELGERALALVERTRDVHDRISSEYADELRRRLEDLFASPDSALRKIHLGMTQLVSKSARLLRVFCR